jgi:ATP-binding cassette subfamily C protein LapB
MTALYMAIVRLASRQGQKPDRLALTESTQVPAPTPQAQLSHMARQLHWPAPRWIRPEALEPTDLPCLIHHPVSGWGVVHSFNAHGQWVQENWDTALQGWTEQAHTDLSACMLAKLHCNAPWQLGRSRIWHQILTEFAQEKSALLQAALTGAMINLVALASSLYSMQVYDRVVPTGASQTLWVLTIGVLAATAFELLAKWSRSSLYDHVIDQVDRKLARSVYAKFLAIRLDQMPTRVGALAAQLRGYETVRQFLSSVVTHTLVDAPFALLFTACLLAIGGWLALIPVLFLAVSVLVGLWSRLRPTANAAGPDGKRPAPLPVYCLECSLQLVPVPNRAQTNKGQQALAALHGQVTLTSYGFNKIKKCNAAPTTSRQVQYACLRAPSPLRNCAPSVRAPPRHCERSVAIQ